MEPRIAQNLEPLGPRIRRQRRRLGLTLDELAGRARISKPYLSLIETRRVANPPSDEKLRRLEQALGFAQGELLTQAHLQRTPADVRAVLQKLLRATHDGVISPPGAEPLELEQAFVAGFLLELRKIQDERVATCPTPSTSAEA